MVALPATAAPSNTLRASFGAAHLAKSLVWSFVDLLLAYFLYSVLSLPADRIARLLFIFLIFGAVCDAAVGAAMTWLRARPRTILVLHVVGATGTGLALFAKFHLTLQAPWLLLAAGLSFRFAFALYDVPQTALTSLLPSDEREARGYVRLRTTLSAVARLLVTAFNLGLSHAPAAVFRAGSAFVLAGMGAIILSSALLLLRAASPVLEARRASASSLRPRPAPGQWRVLLAFLASTTLFATLSRLLIFTPSPPGFAHLGAWLLSAFAVGSVLGPLLAARLQDRFGWQGACLVATTLAVTSGDLLLATPCTFAPILQILAASLYGIGLAAVGAFLWEAASDAVRDHAARTGERSDGLMFGLVIFTIQISIALGSLILGGVLEDHVRDGWKSALIVILVNTVGGGLTLQLLLRPRTPR